MLHEKILGEFSAIPKIKTKDIDTYNKRLIKNATDVSEIKEYILTHQILHRTYFQVSLGLLTSVEQQFSFLEDNADYLQDWWYVDQLTQFLLKPINLEFALGKASEYVTSA